MTTLAEVGRGVISERNELHASGWKDCTQAAWMRMVADGGFHFPLENDLDAEREALERADDWPDEQGATIGAITTACLRRYGFAGHEIVNLGDALVPGVTVAAQGTNANLPVRLLHWQTPPFLGGHAVAFRCEMDRTITILDPMAPMGFAGEKITKTEILRWAWGAAYARFTRWGEANMKIVVDTTQPLDQMVDVAIGKPIYEQDGVTKITQIYVGGSGLASHFGIAVGATKLRSVEITTGGVRVVGFVKTVDCANIRPMAAGGLTEAQCKARVDAAVALAVNTLKQGTTIEHTIRWPS